MLLRPDAFRHLCLARDLLQEVREQPLSIHDIAREARMSPYHFIRRFEEMFGLTPHQYRMRARLDRAKQLLASGGMSVTEVCLEVGMESPSNFSDWFTRGVGTAPSHFQRTARVMVQAPGTLPHDLFPGCLSLMARLPVEAFRASVELRKIINCER